MTRIKICGITWEGDALRAAELGADYLGFIIVESSPRFITPERVAAMAAAVRARMGEQMPKLVGLFYDHGPDYIREIVAVATLDLVQMHGNETEEDVTAIPLPVIKPLRVSDGIPDPP